MVHFMPFCRNQKRRNASIREHINHRYKCLQARATLSLKADAFN